MIKRIVKLTFQEDKVGDFKNIFQDKKDKIRAQIGCQHLELWQDVNTPTVFFTYSIWDSEAALNNYRHSELFQKTWKQTKVLFADKAAAWSVNML